MNKMFLYFFVIACCSCGRDPKQSVLNIDKSNWQEIQASALNSTVQMSMWQGDPQINKYMANFVVPQVKEKYGIDLKINAGQGNELVKILLNEQEAGKTESGTDLCWINGETFFQLRQIDALYGPFTQKLPNSNFIDFKNPFIGKDFQQPIDGFECPWGNVQMVMIYDSVRTPRPPKTMAEFESYLRLHPNRFTIPYEFTGMTLLKSWLIALSGSKNGLNGKFDEEKYLALSKKLWEFINRNRSYFWRNGKTYPESLAAVHLMFSNGELDFSLSNNDSEVDNKILQKIFAPTTKSYVFDSGTIQNSHYLGIPFRSNNIAGAMVVANFLISPEAQFQKLSPSVWGDGTVLDLKKLPKEWNEKFVQLPKRANSMDRSDIENNALQEPDPVYMIRLFEDFRKYVIEK